MTEFVNSAALLLLLLNPFLVVVYLIDIMKRLDRRQFSRVLSRAGVIASLVFCCFAILGDVVFSQIVKVEFGSFQIFGGIILLLIGLQFVFKGPEAIEILRGESEHVAGAIAMPVLIGPGTISASVIIGEKHEPLVACAIVIVTVLCSVLTILLLKSMHDYVRPRKEKLVQRYIEIMGRITALYIGTVSVEMIMRGLQTWIVKF